MDVSLATARSYYEKALLTEKKDTGSLAVLDQILEEAGIKSPREIPLGVQDIALEQIVGTKTEGRKNCFSQNFMPLMKVDTEFASKWISLCYSHLNEGIHTPIKVYEYMNRYYVLEGNKRVSVSKFFDTCSIAADVIRILPVQTDTPECKTYFEYVDFYNLSKINYIQFTKPGCYEKLQELVGKKPGEAWTSEEQMDFNSVFTRFRTRYIKRMGQQPLSLVCDAFLSFMTVFDYGTFIDTSASEMKDKVVKYEKEFQRMLTPEPPTLKTDPFEKKPSIIQTLVPKGKQKIAFIYPKNPDISGWTFIHNTGRQYMEKAFPNELTTIVYNDIELDTIRETLEMAIAECPTVIFTTTPIFLKETLRAAVEHPEIKFLNCNPQMSYKHVRTYYARMYEVKFLLGAIAGAMTENDKIGYIADYPILSAVCDINAFALGAKMVNPRVQVVLKWSMQQYDDNGNEMTMEDIYRHFAENDISIICDRDTPTPTGDVSRVGVYKVEENGIWNMAAPTWNWSVFYEKMASNITNGNWKAEEHTDKGKGLRYWWGLSTGLVDISYSAKLPIGTGRLIELLKHYIIIDNYNPFTGKLVSQEKEIQSDPDATLTPDEILHMDWLIENVVGSIPPRSKLNEQAKIVTTFAGVDNTPYVL